MANLHLTFSKSTSHAVLRIKQVVSSIDPNFSRPLVMYRGEDAAEKFIHDLQQFFDEYIATPKPMLLTVTDL